MMTAICEKFGTSGRGVEVTKGDSVGMGVAVTVGMNVGVGGTGVGTGVENKQAEVRKEARIVIHKSFIINVISVSFGKYRSIIRAQTNVLKSQLIRWPFLLQFG